MIALVTGGGRGIGAGITDRLLKIGYKVIIASRNKNEYIENLLKEYENEVNYITVDISDIVSIKNMFSYIKTQYDHLDLLVNNAGIAPQNRNDILDLDESAFDRLINTNLKGTFFVTQTAVELLGKSDYARIVNISSISSYTASTNRGEYCISKAGISMITKLFATRLAEMNISVLEIQPGIIETDMTLAVKKKYEELIENGITPIRRMGKPDDIAKCVESIAKGNFDFCTGTVIACDGGFSVRNL